jgi:hypothetical protein
MDLLLADNEIDTEDCTGEALFVGAPLLPLTTGGCVVL